MDFEVIEAGNGSEALEVLANLMRGEMFDSDPSETRALAQQARMILDERMARFPEVPPPVSVEELELDEVQHFTAERRATLGWYTNRRAFGFSIDGYRSLIDQWRTLAPSARWFVLADHGHRERGGHGELSVWRKNRRQAARTSVTSGT